MDSFTPFRAMNVSPLTEKNRVICETDDEPSALG